MTAGLKVRAAGVAGSPCLARTLHVPQALPRHREVPAPGSAGAASGPEGLWVAGAIPHRGLSDSASLGPSTRSLQHAALGIHLVCFGDFHRSVALGVGLGLLPGQECSIWGENAVSRSAGNARTLGLVPSRPTASGLGETAVPVPWFPICEMRERGSCRHRPGRGLVVRKSLLSPRTSFLFSFLCFC